MYDFFSNSTMNTYIHNVESTFFLWVTSDLKLIRLGNSAVILALFCYEPEFITPDPKTPTRKQRTHAKKKTKNYSTHTLSHTHARAVCSIFTVSNRCDNSLCELCDSQRGE